MSMPVRSLPVVQNWDCSGCGACCRSYSVPVSLEERRRIDGQDWNSEPALAGVRPYVKEGNWFAGHSFRLNHRADGACVFLDADDRCRIHARFGAAAKPLACRVYPFLLVPAGDHWRLGLRFACPSVAESHGRPLAHHLPEIREFASALEADSPSTIDGPPVPLSRGLIVPWGDVLRIAAAFSKVLGDTSDPLERRWRKALTLVGLCRGLKLDGGGDPKKAATGGRLSELLHVLGQAADDETAATVGEIRKPGWVGRVVFRQVAAVYARKDNGTERGSAQRTPVGRILAAIRFARGSGRIPKVNALVPETTFAAAEEPAGALSGEAEAMLTRYYRLKVESLQFCGAPNFELPFWDGIESLAITFPAILWLARVMRAGGMTKEAAIARALQLVDDNFGFNKLLGLGRQKAALGLLANRGELPRLVAWYGR